jgi:hypothetical protein
MNATDIAAMLDLLAAPFVPLFRWSALFPLGSNESRTRRPQERLVSGGHFGHNAAELECRLVAE